MDQELFLFPASAAQQRLWFLNQLEPESPAYNIPAVLRLRGELNVGALERSLNEIVSRHEALRTTFRTVDGKPAQVVGPPFEQSLPLIDLSAWPEDERHEEAKRLARQAASQPFDLERGPLMRARLLRLAPDEHELILTMHHIVSDGWSMGIFFRELSELYNALTTNRPPTLTELPVQYPDFALWQREWLESNEVEPQLAYWRQQLRGELPVLDLPADRPRPLVQGTSGSKHHLNISAALTEELKKLSRSAGTTLFMTLLGAFQTLLHRYTSQDDLTIGTTIAGRNNAEVEELIGCFLNTLVLRTDLSGDPTFRELLGRVREVTLNAYTNQDVPVEMLLEELQPGRDLSHNPLFQVLFILQTTPLPVIEWHGLDALIEPVENNTAKFDLTIDLTETRGGIDGSIEYNSDLFDASTVARLAEHFENVLASCTAQPDVPVSQLSLLGSTEREQLLMQWSQGSTEDEIVELCVHRMVEAQVERTPDAIAVELAGQRLTYRELNERANQLARHLRTLGVGPEVATGILMERAPDLIVAVLAVLKAGGAYVPLDPAAPLSRLQMILRDSGARVLLTEQTLAALSETAGSQVQIVAVDVERVQLATLSTENLEDFATPDNLAYVIYTSGSTGTPKGVAVQHRSLATYTATANAAYEIHQGDRVLQFASISFDASAEEIYPCLTSGATLVLRDEQMLSSVARFLRSCGDLALTMLDLPTAYWHEVAQALSREELELPPSVRLVIIGGERALPERFAQWRERVGPPVRLVNTYGPTEATIVATSSELLGPSSEAAGIELPIGAPVRNAQAYVLDQKLQPVPIGVAGELHLGGAGVARAYLNRPELTAEKFIPHPFSLTPGERLYRTGDRVRYRPDGQLEYLGRVDQQVKVRGFRIELGEIEAALYTHASVRDALVMLREDNPGEKRLVAYLVQDESQKTTASELWSFLNERLPAYMIPAAFVMLEELPLTPSGKIDRRALPAPDASRPELAQQFVSPRTMTEELIAGIWTELLRVERAGVHDNFFELGGHSLLATQVIARMREMLNVELPLRAFFEVPTVAGLAEQAERERQVGARLRSVPIERAPRDADLPLSFSQERLWFLAQLDPENVSYHVPRAVRVKGALDVSLVEKTWTELFRRHEILRTSFPTVDGRPVQLIHDPFAVTVPVVDLRSLPVEERETEVQRHIINQGRLAFDLAHGPLIRITLLRLDEEEHVLVLAEHHLIHDGWTQGVLMRDFVTIFSAFSANEPSPLPDLSIQYADFAHWQRRWLEGEVIQTQLGYWKNQLAGATPVLELPGDHPRPAIQTFRGAEYQQVLDGPFADELRDFSRRHGATLFMTMLAAFDVLLARYTGQSDISVGSGIANRRWREFENLLGMIINTVVMRADLSGNPAFAELLERVKDVTLGAYTHQDLPFEKLVEELNPPRSLSNTPLFQVMFSFLDTPMTELEIAGLHFRPMDAHNKSAKFDINVVVVTPVEQRVSLQVDGPARHEVTVLWEYNTDIFDESTIVRLSSHYRHLLEAILTDARTRVSDLPLLNEAEHRQLLVEWNNTAIEYPRERCIHDLFDETAERNPQAVALECGEERMTYAELKQKSERLAHRLAQLGVGPDVPVGLCVERSTEMVVAVLGILKVGGAYVPLDPTYPRERLAFMVADAGVEVVLVGAGLQDRASQWDGVRHVVNLADDHEQGQEQGQDQGQDQEQGQEIRRAPRVSPENLAYIMHTSGSTGTPKGVAVTHRNVVRLVKHNTFADVGEDEVFLLLAPLSFDASTFEIWGSLLNGGRLAIAPPQTPTPQALSETLNRHNVTTLWLTAGLFHLMAEEQLDGLLQVKQLLAGGDVLAPSVVRKTLARMGEGSTLINGYGPTESTTFACCYRMSNKTEFHQSVPLGRPIANTTAYVLDDQLQPSPVGVIGELYLGGDGLARGYWKRADLTAERFIPNPHGTSAGDRLYRTGDHVRWLSDGLIEFIGRGDEQVKVRGYRIELGEIETVLCEHEAVEAAVIVASDDGVDGKRLMAYVLGADNTEVTSASLKAHLRERLPEYMMPSVFVPVEQFPLTPNGKIDRRALAEFDHTKVVDQDSYVGPSTEIERELTQLWAELLRVERIGVHDDFFERGGHSLLAAKLSTRLRASFQVEIPLRKLFEAPTIAELAKVIEEANGNGHRRRAPAIAPISRASRRAEV